jgi:DnaJ-class molecular chaperone
VRQIKASFRELARRHHPDKEKDGDRSDIGEKFKRIRQAYEILCDKDARARYDAGESVTLISGGTITEVDLGVSGLASKLCMIRKA